MKNPRNGRFFAILGGPKIVSALCAGHWKKITLVDQGGSTRISTGRSWTKEALRTLKPGCNTSFRDGVEDATEIQLRRMVVKKNAKTRRMAICNSLLGQNASKDEWEREKENTSIGQQDGKPRHHGFCSFHYRTNWARQRHPGWKCAAPPWVRPQMAGERRTAAAEWTAEAREKGCEDREKQRTHLVQGAGYFWLSHGRPLTSFCPKYCWGTNPPSK